MGCVGCALMTEFTYWLFNVWQITVFWLEQNAGGLQSPHLNFIHIVNCLHSLHYSVETCLPFKIDINLFAITWYKYCLRITSIINIPRRLYCNKMEFRIAIQGKVIRKLIKDIQCLQDDICRGLKMYRQLLPKTNFMYHKGIMNTQFCIFSCFVGCWAAVLLLQSHTFRLLIRRSSSVVLVFRSSSLCGWRRDTRCGYCVVRHRQDHESHRL